MQLKNLLLAAPLAVGLFAACASSDTTGKTNEPNTVSHDAQTNREAGHTTTATHKPPTDKPASDVTNTNNKMNTTSEEGIPGVELAADIRVIPAGPGHIGDGLQIKYKVTNRSGKPILLFNQGDINNLGPEGAVYIEPKPDGIVEISERGWIPPTEPSPTFPVLPGAMLLAPGKSTDKQLNFTINLLVARHPYRSMTPGVTMPRPVKRVRYCLGVVPAEGIEARTEGEGAKRALIPEYKAIVTQSLLCSAVQDIE